MYHRVITFASATAIVVASWALPTSPTFGSAEYADPAWPPLSSPYGALTYEGDRIHVVRTDDGHTLLGWTGLQARQARVAEIVLTGYVAPVRLAPAGETCHLRRLDPFGSVVQAILDCGYRRWYTRTWTAGSDWTPPARIPSGDGEVDFDVNRAGGTVGVFAFDDERRPRRMLYRPTADAEWQELPRPPAFGDRRVDWTVAMCDDGVVVLVDGAGSEYAVYQPSTGSWSPVREAPVDATTWRIADDGTLLAWQAPDRFVVGDTDGEWGDPQSHAGQDIRDLALAPDRVVLVEVDEASGELSTRDFDLTSQTWSEPTLLGTGDSWSDEPKLTVNATGDAVVTWAQTDRVGYAAPDLVWHRAVGSSTWVGPESLPDGYDIDVRAMSDGTLAATTDYRADAAGVWLSLRDAE